MIKFPPDFSKTVYPGYYWSKDEQWLYSFKTGILRPLKLYPAWTDSTGRGCNLPHFRISHLGVSKSIPRIRLYHTYNKNPIEGFVPIERKSYDT